MMSSPVRDESGPVQNMRRTGYVRCMKLAAPKPGKQAHCGAPKDAPAAVGKQPVSAGSLYGT